MPTIGELDAVVVASDDDMIPVSQGGAMRRVTRSQLLRGMQTGLSLAPGLLGRSSLGVGAPEHILIGSGLSLNNGVLSGAASFSVAALEPAENAVATDLVAISHGGLDRSVSLGAHVSVAGANVSQQFVNAGSGVWSETHEKAAATV